MKISQLAKKTKVNLETIRFYEKEGLIPAPERNDSGYRQYTEADVDRVQFIVHAKELGFALKEIKELLELKIDASSKCDDIKMRAEQKIQTIQKKIDSLNQMNKTLKKITNACKSGRSTSECPILETIQYGKVDTRDKTAFKNKLTTLNIPVVGAVMTAFGASLCCTLPLAASILGFGVFAGISGFFESLRLYLVPMAGTLLLLGYYFAFRKPRQTKDVDCECEPAIKKTSVKFILGLATFLVISFPFLPEILSAKTHSQQQISQDVLQNSKLAIVTIGGMSCQSCANHLEKEFRKIQGIVKADVSFERKQALICVKKDNSVGKKEISNLIEKAGYQVQEFRWRLK